MRQLLFVENFCTLTFVHNVTMQFCHNKVSIQFISDQKRHIVSNRCKSLYDLSSYQYTILDLINTFQCSIWTFDVFSFGTIFENKNNTTKTILDIWIIGHMELGYILLILGSRLYVVYQFTFHIGFKFVFYWVTVMNLSL